MTTEEKAKAYDEAIERAKRIKNGEDNWHYSDLSEIIPALEDVLPELTENEDERIRKGLIEIFNSALGQDFLQRKAGLDRDKVIAYLEKQKGKMTADEFENSELFQLKLKTKYHNGYQDGMVQRQEKQKERSITANDLDEEIHRFFDDCIDVHEAKLYGNISERVISVDCYEVTARHFAKWGEDHKEQEFIKIEGTTICGQDYKCKKDYMTSTCRYIKDAIYHCSRDGYLNDQNGVSWSCSPEWFKEYIQSNTEWAEEEKTHFVSGQFLQCKLSFDGFKEGEHYWLEYVGNDMYVGRSDNILNQKFHITPRQLFTLFSQELEEVQGPPQEEKQVSLNYEPPFDENPSDKEIVEALIKHLKEQDGFLTAIDSVSTKAILSWLEKQKEQKQEWKPRPESLEALMYAIEGKWDMISPTSYLSRRLEDLYEGLVNTFNVDDSHLAELPKVASLAYTAEDIEELRELKRKIEASMEQKPAEKQDYSGLNDLERAILRGFLCAGVENVPVTIIKETAQDCLAQMKPAEYKTIPKHRGKSYLAYLDLSLNEVEACMLRYFHSAESRENDFEINEDTRKYAKELMGIIQRSDEPQIVDAFKNYTDNGITITCGELEAKPMFKEGDWVVYDGILGHAILKIKDIKDGRYTFVNNESSLLAEDSNKYLRPLTPKDLEPAEWSEEDEEMIGCIIDDIREAKRTSDKEYFKELCDKEIAWLKSLRPQSHWKPSEDQMNEMEFVINDYREDGCNRVADCLQEILEQMKKL